jgi:Sec7-like guanine-nucleotide exchange factor
MESSGETAVVHGRIRAYPSYDQEGRMIANRPIQNDDPVVLLQDIGRLNSTKTMRKACIKKRKYLLQEEIEAFQKGGISALIELKEKRKGAKT